MLIRRAVLNEIVAGNVDLVFRRQKRPTVRSGGTLKTAVGVLDIVSIEPVDPDSLTGDDARRAGYDDVTALRADLTGKPDGEFYRVTVRHAGADPRIALREDDDLGEDDVAELTAKLDRYDAGTRGRWTREFLRMIAEHPHVRAPDLAASIGWDTKPFKEHVRKLKALGLTISHSPGYELSPRGRALLDVVDEGSSRQR
jgi:hypothetical protein